MNVGWNWWVSCTYMGAHNANISRWVMCLMEVGNRKTPTTNGFSSSSMQGFIGGDNPPYNHETKTWGEHIHEHDASCERRSKLAKNKPRSKQKWSMSIKSKLAWSMSTICNINIEFNGPCSPRVGWIFKLGTNEDHPRWQKTIYRGSYIIDMHVKFIENEPIDEW